MGADHLLEWPAATLKLKLIPDHLLGECTLTFLFNDGLHFLLAKNGIISFKHVDDTVLTNIKGFSVIIHLAGYFPAVLVGTFSCWTVFSPLTFHDFPAGPVAFWYHSQSPLLKVITK